MPDELPGLQCLLYQSLSLSLMLTWIILMTNDITRNFPTALIKFDWVCYCHFKMMICLWSEVFANYVTWNFKGFKLQKQEKTDFLNFSQFKRFSGFFIVLVIFFDFDYLLVVFFYIALFDDCNIFRLTHMIVQNIQKLIFEDTVTSA